MGDIKYYYTEAGSAPPRIVSPARTFFTSWRSKVSYSNRASASYTKGSTGNIRPKVEHIPDVAPLLST